MYIPPENSNYFDSEIFDQIEHDVDKYSNKGNIILLGDLNARTGKQTDIVSKEGNTFTKNDCSDLSLDPCHRNNFDNNINSHGKRLLDVCKMFDLKILNGRSHGDSLGNATYHGKNGISVVDYIITDQNLFRSADYFVVEQPSFLSDHSPICAWLRTTSKIVKDNDTSEHDLNSLESIPPQFIWTSESPEPYKKALSSPEVAGLIEEFLDKDFSHSNESVNNAVAHVQAILVKAASMSLKLKHVKRKKRKQNICNKKWFDYDCMKARKNLRRFSNQKHSDPSNPFLRKLYHEQLKNFKELLKSKKQNFQAEKLIELENCSDNTSFWKVLKSTNEDINENKPPPVTEQQWINHFDSLHSKKDNTPEQSFIADNLSNLEDLTRLDNELNCTITEKEIGTCAKILKNKKAASVDKIKNEMIKNSIGNLSQVYRKLFNLIIESGNFPNSWCEGSITPIFKSGVLSDPSNYRGICVSSCLGKFFSSILNQRLLSFIKKNNLLHNSQIGFMPNQRTSDHIFTLRCIIDKYVTNCSGGKVYACFIDLKKAFDSIWHEGLLFKLLEKNVNGKFYELIKNMYSKSECYVKLGTKRTKTFKYARGVRQGCILSPLLFNLYLNDLPNLLENTLRADPIILPNGTKLTSLLYADDLVLISKSREGLQNCINTVTSFCNTWKMTVNNKKSKVMIFSKKCTQKSKQQIFTLDNDKLDVVQEFTYLGVKLSSTGNFSANQKQLKEKAVHAFFNLTRRIGFKKLKPKQANKLFDVLISPILTYGSEVWGAYLKQNFEKWDKSPIEKVHLIFCKYYLGVNRKATNIACRAELGRFPKKLSIDLSALKYFNHLLNLPDDSLAKQAFYVSKSLYDHDKTSYHSNLHQILDLYNIDDPNRLENTISHTTLEKYHNIMKNEYLKIWKRNLTKSRKLDFYKNIKENYVAEQYLETINNFNQRRQYTKFRLSNHQLKIETGRYGKQMIPVENRLCLFCDDNKIETEEHMFLKCTFYSDLRSEFFTQLKGKVPIDNPNTTNSMFNLLTSQNQYLICKLSKFILKCFQLRETIIN